MDKKLIDLYYERPMELSDEDYKAADAFIKEEHGRECIPLIEKRNEEIRAWEEKWPNHCKTCNGAGGFVSHNYPHEPDDYEPCIDCTNAEEPHCARCTAINPQWIEGEDTPCTACGWDWSKGKDDEIPPPYECRHMF